MKQTVYEHDISGVGGGEHISAERLAVFLCHPNENSATELLSFVNPDTKQTNILRLCGTLLCKDENGTLHDVEDLRNKDVDDFIARLGTGKLITSPWFEVINAEGDALSEPLDTISRNPNTERNYLEAIITTRHR